MSVDRRVRSGHLPSLRRVSPWLRAFTAALAILAVAAAAQADDSLTDTPQSSSGKPLQFRPAATQRTDAASAATQNSSTGDSAAVYTDDGDAHGLAQSLLGSGTPSGDPFRTVRPAAAQMELPVAAERLAAVPSQGQAEMVEGSIMSPGGAPLPPADDGNVQGNGPYGDPGDDYGPRHPRLFGALWPHDDLRAHFGQPLIGASWMNWPYSFGSFLGMMRGSTLVSGEVKENTAFFGGVRVGWDYDPYWGLESRLGFASMQTETETSPVIDSAAKLTSWDTDLLYYFWGDSRSRPYFLLGLGLTEFRYYDNNQILHNRGLVTVPIGVGVKYWIHDQWTFRLDLTDNLALGSSGLQTMNNFSATTGVEIRFGGSHINYWPWNPTGE